MEERRCDGYAERGREPLKEDPFLWVGGLRNLVKKIVEKWMKELDIFSHLYIILRTHSPTNDGKKNNNKKATNTPYLSGSESSNQKESSLIRFLLVP